MNNEESISGIASALGIVPKPPYRIIRNVQNSNDSVVQRRLGTSSNDDVPIQEDEQDYSNDLSLFTLSTIGEKLLAEETVKDLTMIQCRHIERSISSMRASLEVEDDDSDGNNNMGDLNNLLKDTAEKLLVHSKHLNSNEDRDWKLSMKLEDVVRLKAYYHFLKTGQLIELNECHVNGDDNDMIIKIQDEEYLSGIIMFCSNDISRYGLRRGIVKDKGSIVIARDIVLDLINCLLEFDFRNGPLRRKYDGLKYSLKVLENTIYELSLIEKEEMSTKNSNDKSETDIVRSNKTEMNEIRERYERYDELREKVIKRCRDVQKYAKQSIFALHRSDYDRADKLISQCESINQELFTSIIQNEPTLRYGSFSNCVEEYVEAILFQTWLRHQRLLTLQDVSRIGEDIITVDEYLGGLLDVTGEIGRHAVARGTERDIKAVRFCLEAVLRIWTEIQKMGGSSLLHKKSLQKKLDALNVTVQKLEMNLYELNLLKSGSSHIDVSKRLEAEADIDMVEIYRDEE